MDTANIHVIFLYEFKVGNNAAKTAQNINKPLGENIANERTVDLQNFVSTMFRGKPDTVVYNNTFRIY